MDTAVGQDQETELRELVARHTVRYEVWPDYLMVKGQKIMVGLDLELRGTHCHGETKLSPGCPRCVETYSDLKRIADWILPREERASEYEIHPFNPALEMDPRRHLQAEVVLRVEIRHRRGFDRPLDQCQERCVAEMLSKLRALGARGGK